MDPQIPLHAFPYDAFQRRAIEVIDHGVSLLLAAPTGAGKTVIADYVIATALQRHQQVIYTAPVKALSNQKFRDFTSRASSTAPGIPHSLSTQESEPNHVVGIMTGDVTINPRASVLIMTTEIYRNTLLEDPSRLSRCAWVIFDEIHYLDDPERGTVWEEAIMFTPKHINLLALSATIPNIEQLAQWIREVHGRPIDVIVETNRPVPLHIFFQCQNKILKSYQELKTAGYHGREEWHTRWTRHRRSREDEWQVHPNRLDALIRHLQETDRLPGIFFTFGRRRAEDLAWEASGLPLINADEQRRLLRLFDELCARYQLSGERNTQALSHLIAKGVAYHHAGMLPTVKEVVEQCFVSRLIKFIVTTETFALGINMPARSVTIDTLKKRVGGQFDLLRSRQFLQMAGRAGRRGLDPSGYVYLRITPTTITYHEVMRVLHSKPEPVLSRLNTGYATLLHLYRQHARRLLEFFPQTFYAFQTDGARRQKGLELIERKLDLLRELGYVQDIGLSAKGEFASWFYGYELLLTELHEQRLFESLDSPAMAVLLVGVVYEPRPGLQLPKSHALSRRLEQLCEPTVAMIHRVEQRFRIAPKSKTPHLQLSAAMEAWFHGAAFSRLSRLCEADDGEIVRYFRMTVQLLRQLLETPAADASLRRKAQLALTKINRDVVDAEQQLRLG